MQQPPGILGIDWHFRCARDVQQAPKTDCADCGEPRYPEDLVTDDGDSQDVCLSCALDRIMPSLPPGQVKKLFGDTAAKVKKKNQL